MTIDDDPTIARIREARRQISEQFDHDPDKLVAYYMELQKQHQSRILKAPDQSEVVGENVDETDLVGV